MTDGPPADAQPALAAETLLTTMKASGVDALYGVSGTDFPSIAEAYGRAELRGAAMPRAMACPHENLAVAMAHGHSVQTGRAQAAMVHVSVGTANMVCGAMNAQRDRTPLLLMAGRTPVTEDGPHGTRNRFIHWAQEMFDQAAMLREAVKWDYELRRGAQAGEAVVRALEVAHAPVQGPVYLSLPREALAEEAPAAPVRAPAVAPAPGPNPGAIDRLAAAVRAAEHPVIVTSDIARDPAAVALLGALAEAWAIPVIQFNARGVCLPADHPMHLGYETGDALGEADLILALECDVPWVPKVVRPRPTGALWSVGMDPVFSAYPMRSFPAVEAITSDAALALAALTEALGAPADPARLDARRRRLAEERARRHAAIAAAGQGTEMTAEAASAALAAVLPANATVVNEYTFRIAQAAFTRTGAFHGLSPAGGLGWGFGAALGMVAGGAPGPVVATLGDGAYLFNNPSACHWASEAHGLPILTVIFNNRRWGAVRNATMSMYPQGAAAASDGMFLADLSPSIDHAGLARAHGAEAWTVSELSGIAPAVDAALATVAGGTQALVALDIVG